MRNDRIQRLIKCNHCGNFVHKLQGSWAHIRNQHSPKSCGKKLDDSDVSVLAAMPTPAAIRAETTAQERERCAKVVEDHGQTWGLQYRSMTDALANSIRRQV